MKPLAVMAVSVLLGAFPLTARETTVTFWVTGGAEGILDGGRSAPGWLGLISHLGNRPEHETWIDVGGTRHLPELAAIPDVRLPDVIAPGEALLRIKGAEFLQQPTIPYVGTNLGTLPQFPEAEHGCQSVISFTHPDGGQIRVLGVVSEQAPLRIPFDRLAPIRVLPVLEMVREVFVEGQNPESLKVLVLPEKMKGSESSRLFPDAQVLIEPANGAAQVIEVAGGSRIRIRPGQHGRSVIRVWARWNTVTKSFSHPKAEVVWVQPVDYETLTLSESLKSILRDTSTFSPSDMVDIWWKPTLQRLKEPTSRPDGIRAQRVPEDDAWMVADVPAEQWKHWKTVEGERWTTTLDRLPRQPRVALPASLAAGRGNWNCPIRQDLVSGVVRAEAMDHTLRDAVAVDDQPRP